MGLRGRATFIIAVYGLPVLAYHVWGYVRTLPASSPDRKWRKLAEPVIFGIMFYLVLVNSGLGGSFIYFQF